MWAVWLGIPVALVKCMDVSSKEVTCSIGASWPILFTDSISTAFPMPCSFAQCHHLTTRNNKAAYNDNNIQVIKVWSHIIYAVLGLCIIVLMHFILSVINIFLFFIAVFAWFILNYTA